MRRVAAYCRVSTDKSDQLNSLEAQKRFFTAYTQRTGDCLVRLYADEGLSGTKVKNRREFLRMMADARQGLFDQLAVKDISRLARNTVDLLQSVRTLKSLGIETLFLTANMTSMGDSEFILTLFAALAQEESANTSKRVKFGKRLNAEKGKVPNLVYGYDKTPGDCFNLSVNPREAAIVRQIYRWYTRDGCGANKIAALLNDRGERTKRGSAWSQNAVSRILANPLYTGQVINGKQEVADFLTGRRADRAREDWLVTHRPDLRIVDQDAFDRAREVLAARTAARAATGARRSDAYLFSTLLRCKECGRSFRRVSRTYRNTYTRWVCSGHNGQGPAFCPNAAAVDEEALVRALSDRFVRLLEDREGGMDRVLGALRRRCGAGAEDPNGRQALADRLQKLRAARDRYMDLYANGLLTLEELRRRLDPTREELRQLEDRLAPAAPDPEGPLDRVLARAFRSPADLIDLRAMTNTQLKRLIRRVEVDREGAVDVYLQPLAPGGTVLLSDAGT